MVFAGSERVASGVGLFKEDCLEKVQAALTGKCTNPRKGARLPSLNFVHTTLNQMKTSLDATASGGKMLGPMLKIATAGKFAC